MGRAREKSRAFLFTRYSGLFQYRYAMIVHKRDGYYVLSEKGRNLGGPYRTRFLAERRLEQIEYFKRKRETIEKIRSL